jgi:hypothetical protein
VIGFFKSDKASRNLSSNAIKGCLFDSVEIIDNSALSTQSDYSLSTIFFWGIVKMNGKTGLILSSVAALLFWSSDLVAQGVTTGTYKAEVMGGCATLVLTGAGPTGNEYSYDNGCDGKGVFIAKSVKVTSRGLQIDQGRFSNLKTNAEGFTGDWSLGGSRIPNVRFVRQ